MVLVDTLLFLFKRFPKFKRAFWRRWYTQLSKLAGDGAVFMNYGFARQDSHIDLQAADEPNRFCIQLYHEVAGAADLKGKKVLEVGSGRGGGASYIHRYLAPVITIGMDLAPSAVAFCNDYHVAPGLSYVVGDALDLPFPDNKFDVVVNVESSHCYPDFAKFVSETKRVLRPGGQFLYVDLREAVEVTVWRHTLAKSEMEIIESEWITDHVLRALTLDNNRKELLIRKTMPAWFRRYFRLFAGLEGTEIYEGFRSGSLEYWRFTMQKPFS